MIDELNGDFLQWLRGFYYVAKTGSVRKAADLMRRSPSTISYQLHSLENELGIILFDRHKKYMRITAEGKNLLKWTVSTFETLQDMRASIGSGDGKLRGALRIATTLPIACICCQPISDFVRENPGVNLEIERCLGEEVRKVVEEGEADFGLLPAFSQPPNGFISVLAHSRPLLVFHKDNPWQIPAVPQQADLEKLPYVAFYQKSGKEELLNFGIGGPLDDVVYRNAAIKVNNFHLIMRFVWQKLGVAMMDEMCFYATNFGANWDNLAHISLEHIFPNRIYGILARRNKYLSPQAKACIEVIKKFFASLENTDHAWSEARQNAW